MSTDDFATNAQLMALSDKVTKLQEELSQARRVCFIAEGFLLHDKHDKKVSNALAALQEQSRIYQNEHYF